MTPTGLSAPVRKPAGTSAQRSRRRDVGGLPWCCRRLRGLIWRVTGVNPGRLPGRLAACARFAARAVCPGLPSWRRKLYHAVDLLLPNSNGRGGTTRALFPRPGRADSHRAQRRRGAISPGPTRNRSFGGLGYEVSSSRPAESSLARTNLDCFGRCEGTGVPIVVLGDVVPGHEAYLAACRRAAGPEVRFPVTHRARRPDVGLGPCRMRLPGADELV